MSFTNVIGLLGPIMDFTGKGSKRWERWRPTVSLCQHEDLLVNRFDLLYQQQFSNLFNQVKKDIGRVSPETEVVGHIVDFQNPWDFEEVYGVLHDFTRGYTFNQDDEYLIHITTGTHVAQICLFLLTESHHFQGKLIQTSPPVKNSKTIEGSYIIIDLDLSRYDRIASRFIQEKRDDISFLKSGIETENPQFNMLIERIERVAINSIDPILLMGPTGAGKSRLARRVFELKKTRRSLRGRFVEVNCATIRGDGAMSTLFGHIKGAFTGANEHREGLLRGANNGILFLDEVGELGIDEQTMLLRAIEEKKFFPVGADTEAESDFQLICGTNRDLHMDIAKGRFREDLLARINLWTFTLPGLSQRPEDISPNLDYELDRFAERNGKRISFNKEARDKFIAFATSPEASWSANFRDLNGAVTRMATLSPGGRITVEGAEAEIERLKNSWKSSRDDEAIEVVRHVLGEEKTEELDLFDIAQLAEVIKICRTSNNLSAAGRKLFSVTRKKKKQANDADRLRKYFSRFDLSWPDVTNK